MNLVVGASGQVGKKLHQWLRQNGHRSLGTGFSHVDRSDESLVPLDMREAAAVNDVFLKHRPSTVFLFSALTNVDYCEDHADEAYAINVAGVQNIVNACKTHKTKLVFASTEYVFDGAHGPYKEEDAVNPLGVYAKTKVEGEKIVSSLPGAIIARTTVVYDWDPSSKNFVMGLIQKLSTGQAVKVLTDQWSHPTLARNLAQILWELSRTNESGVFHVVGPDYTNRHRFAILLCDLFGFDKTLLSPVTTPELKQRARRPLQGGLLTDKIRRVVKHPLVGIRQGLELVREDWRASLHVLSK
ncbi:MAG TPA: SDR family oxidoreductase [Elusimicrobiota bacterium]|nr:SDR family oxidoreductase [Elusimicrobiota bacterium]